LLNATHVYDISLVFERLNSIETPIYQSFYVSITHTC